MIIVCEADGLFIFRVASNFPTAYVRVASQTYVLQHIYYEKLAVGEEGGN